MFKKSFETRFAGVLIALILSLAAAAIPAQALAGAGSAIARIKSGPHTSMPQPSTAPATGNAGEGMTIINGTGHTLYVYFDGPTSKTVKVPDGSQAGVTLVVGSYEVAGEIPGSHITPFYGRQSYEANTHYWLKFFVGR